MKDHTLAQFRSAIPSFPSLKGGGSIEGVDNPSPSVLGLEVFPSLKGGGSIEGCTLSMSFAAM